MRMTSRWTLLSLAFLFASPGYARNVAWVPTWTASPAPAVSSDRDWLPIENRTVRERVRVSVGGSRLRLVLSNEFGQDRLLLGAVSVGLAESAATVRSGSVVDVTFEGSRSVTILPGASVLSDPVSLLLTNGAEISLSLFFQGALPRSHVTSWR
jgi:hypothetical protein